MRYGTFFSVAALLTVLAGGVVTAMAADNITAPTMVGPLTGAVTQLNYSTAGGTVNGFLVGSNVLLTFLKPVCGGIDTLGAVGNSVTYSGLAFTFPSGFQVVSVTSFTNGKITYPPATTALKPSPYPLTPGSITELNYNLENGAIDGFVFTPTSGPAVLVDIGYANATLTPLLVKGAAVSVVGTMEGTPECSAPTGTIPEVYASSLTIGTTVYPVGAFLPRPGSFGFLR